MPLDEKVVREKVRFYLGTFVAYFMVCFVLVKLMDVSKLGKSVTRKLHDSAYASELYVPKMSHQELQDSWFRVKSDTRSKKAVLNKLRGKDYEVSKVVQREAQFRALSDNVSGAGVKFLKSNRLGKDSKYSEGFYTYIDQRRTYLGCEPLLFNEGKVQICWWSTTFLKSVLEDFVVYVCNNHSFLNCLYACDDAPVDHTGNTLIYTTQLCIAFLMSAISGSVLNYSQMPNAANIVFDILVTTPATIAMAKIMKTLYVCPICFSVTYQATHPRVVCMLKYLGKIALLPIIAAIITLLIAAAVFSRGHDSAYIILYFFLQVPLYGFFLELIFSGLMFVSTFYMRSTIDLRYCSIILLEIGRRFTEIIYHENLIENKDYHYRCYYICWILRIECIYKFEDAVRKGYVKEEDRVRVDIEMTDSNEYRPSDSLNYDLYKQESFFTSKGTKNIMGNSMKSDVTMNPMNRRVVIYDEHEERESGFVAHTAQLPVPSSSSINPMYATAGAVVRRSNLQQFGREIATDEDGYDVQADSVTDENLFLRRKEFKDGTRNSFIEVFRKFEEEEQLKSAHTSVERTNEIQHLFNKNKGNALASSRRSYK